MIDKLNAKLQAIGDMIHDANRPEEQRLLKDSDGSEEPPLPGQLLVSKSLETASGAAIGGQLTDD